MEFPQQPYPVDGLMCRRHVIDPHLHDRLPAATIYDPDDRCVVCSNAATDPVELDEVGKLVAEAVSVFYTDPDSGGVPYESREGGYRAPLIDTDVVLWDVAEGCFDEDDEVYSLLREMYEPDSTWVDHNWGGWTPAHVPWAEYSENVCHTTRVFTPPKDENDKRPAALNHRFLSTAGNYLERTAKVTLRGGSKIYRGRPTDGPATIKPTAEDLGPPPAQKAAANRFSSAGISLFYGSADPQTAIAEIAGHSVQPYAVVAVFTSLRELTLLDLTANTLDPHPSLYDKRFKMTDFTARRFLAGLVPELTRPVIPDDRIHIEYAPTQLFTDFIRATYPDIDGIRFASSQTDKDNYVIFCGPHQLHTLGAPPSGHNSADDFFSLDPGAVTNHSIVRSYSEQPL